MALPLALMGAQMGSQLAGGIIGNIAAGDDQDAALAARQAALAAYTGIGVPTIEEQKIALAKLQQVGEYTPEAEALYQMGPSAYEQISLDPRLKDARMLSLAKMQQTADMGFTPEVQVAMAKAQRDAAAEAQAQNAALQQNLAARGMGGGGAELAGRLALAQGAANRVSQAGLEAGGLASRNALNALAQSGQLAGDIGQQEYGQQANLAQSRNAINQFNVQNQTGREQRNVGERNVAAKYNLGEKQRVADTNVGLGNQQEIHNKGLYQTNFQNQLAKAQGVAGQQGQMSDYFGGQAAATRGMWSGIGAAGSQGIAGLGAANERQADRDTALKMAKMRG